MQEIEIFRPGTFTAMGGQKLSFSRSDLKAVADGYDANDAPIVVGHPKHDDPAYGWVRGLRLDDGVLKAQLDQVDPAFAELVRAGRFKKISASFYAPQAEANPKPGAYYLRHVGFLGAQAPAVKGLKPVSFAGGEADVVSFEFGEVEGTMVARLFRTLREFLLEKHGSEDADKALPAYFVDRIQDEAAREENSGVHFSSPDLPKPDKEDPEDMAKSAEEQAAFEAQKAEFAEKEKNLAASVAKHRKDQAAASIDRLIDAGQVAPGQKDGLVEFMASLSDEGETISFAEGDDEKKLSQADFFDAFLKTLPKQIDFGERSRAEAAPANAVADFAAPEGFSVAPERAAEFRAAKEYQRQHPGTDLVTAAKAVGVR